MSHDRNPSKFPTNATVGISTSGDKPTNVSAQCSNDGSNTRMLMCIKRWYNNWAYFVASYPWFIVAICALLSSISLIKIVKTPYQNDITGYTPYGARSRQELAVHDEFFNSNGKTFGFTLLLLPKNILRGNMMESELIEEVAEVDKIITHQIKLFNHKTKRNESFGQFCHNFCDLNEPFRSFYDGFRHQIQRIKNNETLNERIRLNYPILELYGKEINIQQNFFGIELDSSNKIDVPANFSNINKVGMVALIYKAERVGDWSDDEIKEYEMGISKFFEHAHHSKYIRVLSM